jgi:hypothetical protein
LCLDDTKVGDRGIKYLTKCNELSLRETRVTDKGIKYLTNCINLVLDKTKVTDDMKNILRINGVMVDDNDGYKFLTI